MTLACLCQLRACNAAIRGMHSHRSRPRFRARCPTCGSTTLTCLRPSTHLAIHLRPNCHPPDRPNITCEIGVGEIYVWDVEVPVITYVRAPRIADDPPLLGIVIADNAHRMTSQRSLVYLLCSRGPHDSRSLDSRTVRRDPSHRHGIIEGTEDLEAEHERVACGKACLHLVKVDRHVRGLYRTVVLG